MYEPAGPFLDTKGASEYCSIPVATLIDYRNRGVGPAYSRVGSRLIRYSVKDLDAFVMKRSVTALKQVPVQDGAAAASAGADQ